MQMRASVKAVAADHPRVNQAGVIIATDGNKPAESVTVRWDVDQVETVETVVDLVELGSN